VTTTRHRFFEVVSGWRNFCYTLYQWFSTWGSRTWYVATSNLRSAKLKVFVLHL